MILFKLARVKKNLTQKQLSELLGMSVATINRLETGNKSIEDMKIRDLRKICSTLSLDILELLK